MPAPGVIVREGETRAAAPRMPGDVSAMVAVGTALRGPADRPFEVTPSTLDDLVGPAFGASHLRRGLERFFRDGGSRAFVSRAVDATAAAATANIVDAETTPGTVLTVTADGPGTWGNGISVVIAPGSTASRRIVSITDAGRVRVKVEVESTAEAVARLTKPGLVKVAAGAAAWPPKAATTPLAGGVAADASVTANDVVGAIGRIPASVGPCTLTAPGNTTQSVHEELMKLARSRGWHFHLDLPNISDASTVISTTAALRAFDDEKGGRNGKALWPWEQIPIGPFVSVPVPPSCGQAGREARADRTDRQRQGRAAAGPEYVSADAIGVTQTPTEAELDQLHDAGVTVIRQEPEGVCANGARTLVSADRWPQYLYSAGARTRMAIVDEARLAVRPLVHRPIDGDGVQLEAIRGAVIAVCKPYAARGQLFARDGDEGFSVEVVSTLAELEQGRVRIRLGMRTSPSTELIEIEFTAVALSAGL